MKKLIYLIVALVILGLIASGCFLSVVPPAEKDEISMLTKVKPNNNNNGPKPGTDFNGPHYNLNLIGKKADWSGGGSYNNPDRHTMFVPEYTDGTFQVGIGNDVNPTGTFNGIKISIIPGSEFAVIDGNAFDEDGGCVFQMPRDRYKVYIVAKAKPGDERYTDIVGWVYAEDETGTACWYLNIGDVHVKKSKDWIDATHIFEVDSDEDPFGLVGEDDMWVFEYMNLVEAYLDDPLTLEEYPFTEYFWQYDNHGNKLIKVRFYLD
jgi:hypothetical protein